MEINIQNAKIELIQWLTTLEDRSLIQKIMDLRNREPNDWWDEVSDAEKKSIESGIADADKGNLKPQAEAKKIYGKWL
ncbi:hypothetical protein [Sinomicrobium weinanense]|uniref:Uncharacterized protein n=1 Tax=Sinomicrobium weinanense TaxID=2842200 RepID=A0A926JNK2_9FLAO|nr:hypothetical protein [Sinomicrobium weinanense]MBC9794412.1 hypothetical protein [Sinomicrobium weinanense]MBU3124319.1 hypothetical protein [Sinomicrobium weinanense]